MAAPSQPSQPSRPSPSSRPSLARRLFRHGVDDQDFDRRRSLAYDRHARWGLRGLYRRVARDVAGAAGPDDLVVDVGTGPARLLHDLAALRPDLRLHGVDRSPDMIEIGDRAARDAGLTGRLTLRVADVAALPYGDGEVGLLVSTLSMHHWPDPRAAAAELGRVLRPGGLLLIYDFRFAPLARTAEELRALPAFAGSEVRRRPVRTGRLAPPLFARLEAAAASAASGTA